MPTIMPVIGIMLCSLKHLFVFQRDDDDVSDSTLTDSVLDDEGGAVMPSQRVCVDNCLRICSHVTKFSPIFNLKISVRCSV